jgi:hypothetical protein
MKSHTTVKRIAAMGFAGVAWLIAIVSYQHAFRLTPAPDHVQESGLAIVRAELEILSESPFGQTKRGQLIVDEIRQLLAEQRVVFAPMTLTRGLTWDPILGAKVIYVKVIEMRGGRFLHQQRPQIIEALVHETVHSIKNTRRRISIEEELDCFEAGIEAAAISAGIPRPVLFLVDGQPVEDFVLRAYPKAAHDAAYLPLGKGNH